MTIRAAIIGTGIVAAEHAVAIAMLSKSISLVAAADINAERLEKFCNAYHVPRRIAAADDLITDPSIDLVVVATPPSTHEEFVVAALERDKYVLCEKPIAHSLASARRILDAEMRHSGKLSVSYQLRQYLPHRRTKWICENGWIGKIKGAVIEWHEIIPHLRRDTDIWWGAWKIAGGGVLLTQVIHQLDLLMEIMGRPLSVSASMDTRFTHIELEDYAEVSIEFAEGRHADCIASVESGHRGRYFEVAGSDGTVGFSPWKLTMADPGRQARVIEELERTMPALRAPDSSNTHRLAPWFGLQSDKMELTPHARLYAEIAQSIQNSTALPIPPNDALGSFELCMAAYESALTGKRVSLPLAQNTLVYDGVGKSDYDGRQCERRTFRLLASFASPPAAPESPKKSLQASLGSIGDVSARSVYRAALFGARKIKSWLRAPQSIRGGPQTRNRRWPSRRNFDKRERRAVMKLMDRQLKDGNALAYGGIEEKSYCEAFAEYLGGGYADAVNSGTNALYVALRALDLEPGSEIIVPPATDAGGMMPVPMNMCIPVPADLVRGAVLTSAEQIERVMTDRTSAIVAAHIGGYPLDMDPILELASRRRIPVVEDCAQSHGAMYKGRMVGTLGTIAAFSTMYGKHHCTGSQGGVVFTRDPLLFVQVKRIADRGKAIGASKDLGNLSASLNFNQDELSMAIGRVQLQKLPKFINARRAFVALVRAGLQDFGYVSVVDDPDNSFSTYFFLLLRLDLSKLCCDSRDFALALAEEGIGGAHAGYAEHPTDQPWYRDGMVFGTAGLPWSLRQYKPQHFELPNVHEANRELVRIEVHEQLGAAEARDLVTAVEKLSNYFRIH